MSPAENEGFPPDPEAELDLGLVPQEQRAITGPTGRIRECGCSDTEVCEDCEPWIREEL